MEKKKMGKNGLIAIVLGVIGIFGNLLLAIIGHALCIAGICLGVKENNETGNKIGLIVCIVGEVLSIVNSILGVLIQAGIL